MASLSHAATTLTHAILELVTQQARSSKALNEIAREQHITNLIVRAQLTDNPEEKKRLLGEVRFRMDSPRRHSVLRTD